RWAAKHVVFQLYAFIDGDVVLNLYVVANDHSLAHDDVLAQITVLAQLRVAHDVRKMPNLASFPNFSSIVDHGRGVCVVRNGRFAHFHRESIFTEGMLACLEDFQDTGPAFTVGARRLARTDAIQEMFALAAQGFRFGEAHNLAAIA